MVRRFMDLIWWVSGSWLYVSEVPRRRLCGWIGLGLVGFGFEFELGGGQNVHNVGVLFFFFVVLLDFLPGLLGKVANDGGFSCLGFWVTMVGSVAGCVVDNDGGSW